jgi:hypothetical protein
VTGLAELASGPKELNYVLHTELGGNFELQTMNLELNMNSLKFEVPGRARRIR